VRVWLEGVRTRIAGVAGDAWCRLHRVEDRRVSSALPEARSDRNVTRSFPWVVVSGSCSVKGWGICSARSSVCPLVGTPAAGPLAMGFVGSTGPIINASMPFSLSPPHSGPRAWFRDLSIAVSVNVHCLLQVSERDPRAVSGTRLRPSYRTAPFQQSVSNPFSRVSVTLSRALHLPVHEGGKP
jgi:hypothetical protein